MEIVHRVGFLQGEALVRSLEKLKGEGTSSLQNPRACNALCHAQNSNDILNKHS